MMLHNYFKTSSRYLTKHKTFSGINLIGLAVGLSVCFFALSYVAFELSYDDYHEKADRIYRLVTDVKTSIGIEHQSSSAFMGPAIQDYFPEVQASTRVFLDYLIIEKDHDVFGEENIAYADSSLFSVFTFPLIDGDPRKILNAPWNVVLSESAARKYFGTSDPIGKILTMNGSQKAYVTGIMKNMPYNSHFRVDILISMSSLITEKNYESWMSPWRRFGFYTFVVLPDRYDMSRMRERLPGFVNQYAEKSEGKYTLQIEPLKDIYFYSEPRGSRTGGSVHGDVRNIYIFSLAAVFVLFIACFNFINLCTAFSINRAKEIGVRKVLGSSKRQLIIQFLIDSIFLCIIAFVLALFLCQLLLPVFNSLAGKIIVESLLERPGRISMLLPIAIMIGLFSGAYPAFFLSGLNPLRSLKGSFASTEAGNGLRKGLVIVQFSVSIVLIVSTLVVYSQLSYMRSHELGFKKDHMLVMDFQFDGRVTDHEDAVKQQLSTIPGIGGITMSSSVPGRPNHKFPTAIENANAEIQELQSDAYYVDYDFLDQYEIKVLVGRPFSKQFPSDLRESMIINEAAAKGLGFRDLADAIGKRFWQRGDTGLIIGVVRDFHFHSFEDKVRPLTFQVAPGLFSFLSIEVSSQDLSTTISQVENKWKEIAPGMPLHYFFSDEAYNAQYHREERFGKLFSCFAFIAILLTCLGLMALSGFTISRRTKEIGIRKVLGSSVHGIVVLLLREFMVLIVIACIFAMPLASVGMNKWLAGFAYRIDIDWWIFAVACFTVLTVAFITIGFQTIKAANANPVKSLKME